MPTAAPSTSRVPALKGYAKILCATDLSECSEEALAHAEALARRFEAQLVILHVVEPLVMPVAFGFPDGLPVSYEQASVASATRLLEPAIKRLKDDGLRGHLSVVLGSPAEEVCALASRGQFDLVVVGTHGHRGLKHVLLGSTAERILRLCSCPVLAVKAPAGRAGSKPA